MPAPLKARRAVELHKIETTYGTDAAPVAATDGMLVSDLSLEPIEGESVRRENVQPYLGARQEILTGVHAILSRKVELAGSGAAGTAPKYGALLRSCGHSQVVSVGVDVQYSPVDTGEESGTSHVYFDGQKHPMLGSRGSIEISIVAGQLPMITYKHTGLYVAPTSAANPAPDLSGFQLPKAVGKVNTPTFTLHGYAGKLQSFTLTQGNEVTHRDLPGEESIQISDRNAIGQIVIEEPPIATKDFWAITKASTLGALQIIHGTTAGNIVQFDAANLQLGKIKRQVVNGILMLAIPLIFIPTAATPDYLITVK